MENLFEKACKLNNKANYIKAFELYRQAAEMGHGEAYKYIGDFYRLGRVVSRDVEKAARCYKKSAELGFKDGLHSFAAIRWFKGVDERERSEGLEAMTEYYDGDKGMAHYELGRLQEGDTLWNWDETIAGDYGKAIEHYKKSAELGCAKGYYKLAEIYSKGCRWIKKDKKKALELYEKAADMGEPNAWWDLGCLYKMGDIVEQDIDKFISCFNKAAELGSKKAFIDLAVVYSEDEIVPKDEAKAMEYMVKYSDGDEAHAYYLMGRLYDDGFDRYEYDNDRTIDLPSDNVKAAEYYKKSAELGSTAGCFRLALLYEDGRGVKEDLEKARQLYERAVEKDDKKNYYALIMLYLSKFHDENKALELAVKYMDGNEGEGCYYIGTLFGRRSYDDDFPQDCKKAAQYYLKSIELGCMKGCEDLAELYLKGDGVEQDEAKALEYMKMCGKGDGWAYYSIGHKFSYFDDAKAAEYYEKAAELNDADGAHYLAYLYLGGSGVEQDYRKAVELFKKSGDLGFVHDYEQIAKIYLEGLTGDVDVAKAAEFLIKIYGCSMNDAIYHIGKIYEDDYEDLAKAAEFYEKAAAELGSHKVYYKLGKLYGGGDSVPKYYGKAAKFYEKTTGLDCGDSVPKYYGKAAEFYEKAAELGSGDAYGELLLLRGKEAWTNGDEAKALEILTEYYNGFKGEAYHMIGTWYDGNYEYHKTVEYYGKGAKLGSADACYDLAGFYGNRDGLLAISHKKSAKYYIKAADLGHGCGCLEAGKLYEEGRVVEQDYSKAALYYKKGIENNNEDCLEELALLYIKGQGVEQNDKKAFELMVRYHGDKGYAYCELGDLYSDGNYGIEQNYAKAALYYGKGAEYRDEDCLKELALLHTKGQGGVENDEKIHDIIVRCYYDKGEAYCELGDLYSDGNDGIEQDYAKAAEYYEKGAEYRDKNCLKKLALLYLKGQGVEQSDAKALHFMVKYSKNEGAAFYDLGDFYQEGEKVPQNYVKALDYYKKALMFGCTDSYNQIGVMYHNGHGVKKDYDKAVEYYKKGVEHGSGSACYNLGVLYDNGDGVEKSLAKAVELWEKAAALGNEWAYFALGSAYHSSGEGIVTDYVKAAKWYDKAVKRGDSRALTNLGNLYKDGKGVQQNYERAMALYEKALSKDRKDKYAYYNIGEMYFEGLGVNQDYVKAAKYYKKAANLGHVTSNYKLGEMYSNGIGTAQDDEKASKHWKKAAKMYKKLIDKGIFAVCYDLGDMYLKGQGVEQDYAKAAEYFEKGVKENVNQACTSMGYMYEAGLHFPQDYVKAAEYYQKGADLGDGRAFNNLGTLYARGDGVEQDYDKARELFEKAVEYGSNDAYHNLANIYSDGLGSVAQDKKKALEYYELAARSGEAKEKSIEALEELKKSMADELE